MNEIDQKQFLHILDANQHRIQKLCAMYTAQHEDQKDLEQEVVLNIWKSYPNFKGDAKVSTWIYRIILNLCLKHRYATTNNQKTVSLEIVKEVTVSKTSKDEKFQDLRECIRALEFSDKSIIILYLEDLPYKSIADIIGITENHVAVKIKRIKAKLLTCLKNK